MSSISELLHRSADGEPAALQALCERLYPEIRRVARARLAQSGSPGGLNGLDTTALVHEGFLRMADSEGLQGRTRSQFFACVGQVLRSVVVDFLRAQDLGAAGGQTVIVALSGGVDAPAVPGAETDLVALDRALARMQQIDLPLYELIEMHGFAGLTIAEIAAVHGVSPRTVNRDLVKARALLRALRGEAPGAGP
jgi:RNA polymerase sigma factor (TIGR02999 family)